MLALKGHKLDAWLHGDSLREVDGRVQLADISQEMSVKTVYAANTGRAGRRRGRIHRDVLKITISFTLFEFMDIWARDAALESINAWARDGYLEISTKPGRRVFVNCTGRAAAKQPRNHKEVFQLTFETDDSPFWEDAAPTVYALSGTTASESISVPGTRESAPADVTVTPGGGTLNALTLTLGETRMSFTGLNVAAGQTLALSHDEQTGFLLITAGNVSKYTCRGGESDDELTCSPGRQTVGFAANTACEAAFSVRGRYE